MTNDQTGRTPRQTTGGSPAASTIMIIVTVVAVVIGFFILKSIRDDDSGASSVGPTPTNGTGGSSTTAEGLGSTTVATPTTVGDVKTGSSVQVANASGVGGAAGKLTTDLKTAGFTTVAATDSAGDKLDTTVVYYVATDPVAQQVATTVARSIGVAAPAAMPTPIPVAGGQLTEGAGVLVVLGKDKAGKSLTAMTTTAGAGAATTAAAAATTTTAG